MSAGSLKVASKASMSAHMPGSIQSSGSTMEIHAPRASSSPRLQGSVALVLLVDDADALVASSVCLHDGERAVRAAVVQADDLQLAVRLRENAVEALRKVRLALKTGTIIETS